MGRAPQVAECGTMTDLTFRERPAAGEAAGLLVLHHGRGADEHDLLGLADVLDPQARLHVATPRAPLTLPGWPGHHWYVVPRVGYPDHDTFHAAYAALARLPRRAAGSAPASALSATVLGGFSMGSVMSYALGLGPDRPGAGRASSRSRASCQSSTAGSRDLGEPARAVRAFIAHGRRDPVMEVGFARRARELLRGGRPARSSYHESDAAHHIDPAHIEPAALWLTTALGLDRD